MEPKTNLGDVIVREMERVNPPRNRKERRIAKAREHRRQEEDRMVKRYGYLDHILGRD